MSEYEIRFSVTKEIEERVRNLFGLGELELIKEYEFEDFYFEGNGLYARVRKWYKPVKKVEVIYTNYERTSSGKKGEKIKIPVYDVEEGKRILESSGFRRNLIHVKKLNGKHYKFTENENVRIAIEDVYVNGNFFERMGKIEILCDNDKEAENFLEQTVKLLSVKNYSTKSLLEILSENYL
jgi:adenylate cyclase class IV